MLFAICSSFKNYISMGSTEIGLPPPSTMAVPELGSPTTEKPVSDTKPKKKICCACPDTKRLRDECIVEHGEAACAKWIRAHRECLRAEGFKI
ncbi:hypothetical protein IFM89_028545 [Coptis chinensis]|uniref:Cytochrome c oxidase copper chaperone n=1 Tax=Coptis chinensis TaxID=261450 RepID=A0A835IFA1_9MAGN|nr:hypothetical protein IFM89_028545 [Coptis chinensis]